MADSTVYVQQSRARVAGCAESESERGPPQGRCTVAMCRTSPTESAPLQFFSRLLTLREETMALRQVRYFCPLQPNPQSNQPSMMIMYNLRTVANDAFGRVTSQLHPI